MSRWTWNTAPSRPQTRGALALQPLDVQPRFVVVGSAGAVDHALRLAGARTAVVPLDDLLADAGSLDEVEGLVLPACGDPRLAGLRLRLRLLQPMLDLAARGGVILGLGDGFQALVHSGLLPGLGGPQVGQATFAPNASGRFETRWVHLRAHPRCPSPLLADLTRMEVPVRCALGRLVTPFEWEHLEASGHLALQYTNLNTFPSEVYPVNPTGSPRGAAGLCDPTGRILGMTAHPEDHLYPWQHPDWPRFRRMLTDRGVDLPQEGHGLEFFRTVVRVAAP